MPYILEKERGKYEDAIKQILDVLPDPKTTYSTAGELNFIISTIIFRLFERNPCYKTGNDLMGVLSAAQAEFYRRKLSILEDEKIIQNGDI